MAKIGHAKVLSKANKSGLSEFGLAGNCLIEYLNIYPCLEGVGKRFLFFIPHLRSNKEL